MDASAYAFVHGVRSTRATLSSWQRAPVPVLARWVAGSAAAATGLLLAVWLIATLDGHYTQLVLLQPPFSPGDTGDVLHVLRSNMLVLALHAMACVAGFIAGSALPMQVEGRSGVSLWLHEHGGRLAIAFVVGATTFSLSAQASLIGHTLAGVSNSLQVPPAAGGARACGARADRAVPAARGLDHRQPPRRVGADACRQPRDRRVRDPDPRDQRLHRGIRLAAHLHRADASAGGAGLR
jgi:hypothetical protein